jgi:hypothetical protein
MLSKKWSSNTQISIDKVLKATVNNLSNCAIKLECKENYTYLKSKEVEKVRKG